nr:MAG TPA: hypothetical protein [Caudoviricetes sp.]
MDLVTNPQDIFFYVNLGIEKMKNMYEMMYK